MSDLSNDLFQSEVESIDHSRALDAIEPLTCDRWVALSAMQKAIRRGDSLAAQRAQNSLSARSELNVAAAADHSVRGRRNRRAGRGGHDSGALRQRESPPRNGKGGRSGPGDGSDARPGSQGPQRRLAVHRRAARSRP
jgi:hypothetical protein